MQVRFRNQGFTVNTYCFGLYMHHRKQYQTWICLESASKAGPHHLDGHY